MARTSTSNAPTTQCHDWYFLSNSNEPGTCTYVIECGVDFFFKYTPIVRCLSTYVHMPTQYGILQMYNYIYNTRDNFVYEVAG